MKKPILFTPLSLAAALPLVLFAWIVPKGIIEADLWLLWLLAMALVGLPLMFTEAAFAKRSAQSVFSGLQMLTREADASTKWRSFSYLSAFLCLFLVARISGVISTQTGLWLNLSLPDFAKTAFIAAVMLIIMPTCITPLRTKILPIAALSLIISAIIDLFSLPHFVLALTPTSLGEWGIAVALSLVSIGAGTGLYWFLWAGLDTKNTNDANAVGNRPIDTLAISKITLSVWLSQIAFGILAFVSLHAPKSLASLAFSAIGALLLGAFLLSYALSIFMGRFGKIFGAAIVIIATLLLATIPPIYLFIALIIISLVSAAILAIFAGFCVKISHLRKSFAFKNELRYNLWRILVRIVVPLSILLAAIGFGLRL